MNISKTFQFDGKFALVTGGTSGIGLAIAQKLAENGAHVVINSENQKDCDDTVEHLRASGFLASSMPANLSDKDSVFGLASRIKAELSRLDAMFLNAGVTGNPSKEPQLAEANIELVFNINVHAPRILCDELLPFVSDTGGGAAVIMSSLAGLRGNKHIGAYSLTKAAVAQLARDMAVTFGPDGVRVNAISPGLIATGWEKNILSDAATADRRMRMTPLRRIGQPEEVANAALFLASDLASFITGHNLVVDGGTLITDGN